MQLLFVHDHRFFRRRAGRIETTGSLPAWVWQRYLRHFDNIVVIARDGGAAPERSEMAASNHPLVAFEFAPSLASARQLLFPSRSVRRQIDDAVRRADAVVARVPSELGLLAAATARALGKPYALEIDGCPWDCYRHHGTTMARLYAPLAFARLRRAVRRAPLALYVTTGWLQSRYPSRGYCSAASNAEILGFDEAGRKSRERRLEALARGRRPVLGTVASLAGKYKGVQTAVAAVAQLRSEGIGLRYSVIGAGERGPWRTLARAAGVEDLISFDGPLPAGEPVRQWLDGIDIHLQPSFHEGLPRATVEAMSRGVACIGSTCGGIPELLPSDRMHWPGDAAGLAACVGRLANDSQRVREASLHGLATARNYLPEALRARRDEIYGRLRQMAEKQAAVTSL